MTKKYTFLLQDEAATLAMGKALASCDLTGAHIGFSGALGMGKTTLIRGLMQGLGYAGSVKSPSYALVETYDDMVPVVHHFDLYRIQSADELYELGIESYFDANALVLVEWPENDHDTLPVLDIHCTLSMQASGRSICIVSHSALGQGILQQLTQVFGQC